MRYKIISTEELRGLRWVNQTIASFTSASDAIALCPRNAYVIDAFTLDILHRG
jgi:hypothetical protein